MNREEMDNIVLREKENKLSISRVPKKVKEEFITFANEEFCDDYGACLHYVWDNFKIWHLYFENLDLKLNEVLNKLDNISYSEPKKSDEKMPTKEIKFLSGKRIVTKKEVNNDG